MLDAALVACEQLFEVQREALELPYPGVLPEPATPDKKKAFGS
jgi:ribonuclease PH